MEVKKIVEGMTAPQVAQVIDENFNALNGEKATVEAVEDVQKNVNRSDDNTGVLSYPEYSSTEPVAMGDVRRYEGLLYRAKEAGAHDWDPEKWERVTLKQLEDEKLSELGSEVAHNTIISSSTSDDNYIFKERNWDVVQGYAISGNSGAALAQSAYSYLLVNVEKYRGKTIKYARMVHEEGSGQGLWGVGIYNNDTVSKESAIFKSGSIYGNSDGYTEVEILVPEDAVYGAFTFFTDNVEDFYVKLSVGLDEQINGLNQCVIGEIIQENIFDGNNLSKGTINDDGSITENESSFFRYTKDFIKIIGNTTYYRLLSENLCHFAFYDEDKIFISKTSLSAEEDSVVTPKNAYYTKINMRANDCIGQVVGRVRVSEFVEYNTLEIKIGNSGLKDYFDNKLLEYSKQNDKKIEKIEPTLKKVEQEVFGEVFDKYNSEVVQGYAISGNSGAASAQSAYSYLLVNVEKYRGKTIKYARMVHEEGSGQGLWGVGIYNNDTVSKESAIFKSGSIYGNSDGYTEVEILVPEDAICAAFTFYSDESIGYFYMKASEGLSDKIGKLSKDIEIQLPTESVAVVGHEWNLFYQNICPNYNTKGVFFNGGVVGNSGYSARRLHTVPIESNVGDHTVNINIMNDTVKTIDTIAEYKFPIHVVADSPTSRNIVFIGDSLTDAAVYAAEIEHNLSHGKYHSIGTRSGKNNKGSVSYNDNTYEVLHEGRSGWRIVDYTTVQTSSDGVLNPFYNPSTGEFDFSYYMQTYQQSVGKIDAVCLNLGTNDQASYASRFSAQVAAINKMIDSIHSYDANIKVLVWLAPNNANGSNNRVIKIRLGILRDVLMETFGERTDNIFLTDIFIAVDGDYDFTCDGADASARNPQKVDEYSAFYGLHPNNYGYLHIADCLYAHLLYRLEV